MKLSIDPAFPDSCEDEALLPCLANQKVRPIFIMGLHRSGTTFLYDCIARSFPVAQLSLYHLFYYHRLLSNHQQGNAQRDKDRLNACFQALGIKDRNIDRVPINADEVEEYGFLLRQLSGKFSIGDGNVELFRQLCQKLLFVHAESQAVLLKNPWDTGNAETILEHFPDARFVYISREPLDVLNSMLNALQSYLAGPQHYLELLLGRGKSRQGYRLGYGFWWCMWRLRQLLGNGVVAKLFRPVLARTVAAQVVNYRREIAALPSHRAVEIDYQRLSSEPETVLKELAHFLDLPIALPPMGLEVRRRKDANPVLANYRKKLDDLISQAESRYK